MTDVKDINSILQGDRQKLDEINTYLESLSAIQRIEWAFQHLPDNQILSSSFGIQSAVMLHMTTTLRADIPVVLVDTGYLFAETYQFIDEMERRLKLNLHIYRSKTSPAWQEARHGELWKQGLEGIEHYNRINKVEPFNKAFEELKIGSWFAGLRRQQSNSRKDLSVLKIQHGRFKVHPIIDWSNRDVNRYLTQHNLPYHPLWDEGYVSVGDHHTSQPLVAGMNDEQTRFFGLKRECGLHE